MISQDQHISCEAKNIKENDQIKGTESTQIINNEDNILKSKIDEFDVKLHKVILFIGGMPSNFTQKSLINELDKQKIFEGIHYDSLPKVSFKKGYCFIFLRLREKLNDSWKKAIVLKDKTLEIRVSLSRKIAGNQMHETKRRKVYVSNISQSVSDEDFMNYFKSLAQIDRAYQVYDETIGCQRGFGFVEFINDEDAEAILMRTMNDPLYLHGQVLNMKPALMKFEIKLKKLNDEKEKITHKKTNEHFAPYQKDSKIDCNRKDQYTNAYNNKYNEIALQNTYLLNKSNTNGDDFGEDRVFDETFVQNQNSMIKNGCKNLGSHNVPIQGPNFYNSGDNYDQYTHKDLSFFENEKSSGRYDPRSLYMQKYYPQHSSQNVDRYEQYHPQYEPTSNNNKYDYYSSYDNYSKHCGQHNDRSEKSLSIKNYQKHHQTFQLYPQQHYYNNEFYENNQYQEQPTDNYYQGKYTYYPKYSDWDYSEYYSQNTYPQNQKYQEEDDLQNKHKQDYQAHGAKLDSQKYYKLEKHNQY